MIVSIMETAVIIASWNGKKYLKDCFDSLAAQSQQNFKIVFVDNGSSDGSVDFVENNYMKDAFSGRLEIVALENNTGFSKGYNIGIEKACEDEKTRYFLVLNNDTLLHENFIENIVECIRKHSDAGSIQPKVLNYFERKRIDCLGIVLAKDGTAHNRGYGEIDEGQYDREEEIFGANGTAALYSREALKKIQFKEGEYFDDSHFAYYEDTDLAWRMRLAGFKAYTCPKAIVWHLHSATTGKTSLFKAYYLHRNYFFAVFKNYPAGIMGKTLAWRLLSYIRLVFSVFRKEKKETDYVASYGKGNVSLAIIRAWGSVFVNVPGILHKRYAIRKKRKVSTGEIKSWLKKFFVE